MFIELLFSISFFVVLLGLFQISKIPVREHLCSQTYNNSPRPHIQVQNCFESQRAPLASFSNLRKDQDKPQQIAPTINSADQLVPIAEINTYQKVQKKWSSFPRFSSLRALSEKPIFPKRCTGVEVRFQDQRMMTSDNLRNRICRDSVAYEQIGNMKIFKVNLIQLSYNPKSKFRKFEFGQSNTGTYSKEKVILLVGETGSGKTTLINSMINYVFGVEFEYKDRYKLVIEDSENQENQAHSQTTWITAYTIHHQKGFKVNYTLTIIDTPGFGDTRGIQRDAEITKQIKTFFTAKGNLGIGHINAVGLVAQSSLPRLTFTQKYIFDQILSLFGKDIGDNIYLMLTFADGKVPQVLNSIKEANLPHQDYFKFNNSVIFEDSSSEDELSKMFWNMGMKSFNIFFNHFATVSRKSLTQTKLALEERERIETQIEGLHAQVKRSLSKLEQLKLLAQNVEKHNADIARNKDFTYVVEQDTIVKHLLEPNTYVTNCLTCNFTCHLSCAFSNDVDKYKCSAMNGGGRADAHCTVCINRCHWSQHKNMRYYFSTERKSVTKTSDDLKQRYQDANGKAKSAQMIVYEVESEYKTVQAQTITITEELRQSINKMNEFSLKPTSLSNSDYLGILIESEKSSGEPGWRDRVQQLTKVKEMVDNPDMASKQDANLFQDRGGPHKGKVGDYLGIDMSTFV